MDKILHHLKDRLRLALELMRDIYDIKWLADFVYGQHDGFTYICIYIYITCLRDCFKTYDTTIQNQEIDSKNQKTRDSSIIYIYIWSGSFYLM